MQANCQQGAALIAATRGRGSEAVVHTLLGWRQDAARADSMGGSALILAASAGHMSIVKTLLEWPVHAPRADCYYGEALVMAALDGHEEVRPELRMACFDRHHVKA